MHAIILCGIQATGKSTFCQQRLFHSHIRISLDMLKTRHREDSLLRACLDAKQAFVIDNTNPTREERLRYLQPARDAGFRTTCYYFESRVSDSLRRNASRPEPQQVPDRGIKGTSGRLEIPNRSEGFDEIFYVRITDQGFDVQGWQDEV